MSFFPLFLVFSVFLSGCGKFYPVHDGLYIPSERPQWPMCLHDCRKNLGICQEKCSFAQRACFLTMRMQALKDYESFMREQVKTRQSTYMLVSDFEHPEKCPPTNCRPRCDEPYNLCYKKCGGQIEGNPRSDLSFSYKGLSS